MPAKPRAAAQQASLYAVHPGVAMTQKWIAEMREKTGRSLAGWLHLIREQGPAGEKELAAWLKQEHEFGTNNAGWLAQRAAGRAPGLADEDPDAYLAAAPRYVDEMYTGKEALRPIHDAVVRLVRDAHPEVRICPCTTMVPFYREHVFARTQPTTRTRVDVGLALKGHPGKLPARLLDTGGLAKGDRITHRMPLTSASEVDAEVGQWLAIAWELDAPKKNPSPQPSPR